MHSSRKSPNVDERLLRWFWPIAGIAVIALTLPLAVKMLSSGELMHACPSSASRGLPLDKRAWQLFGGWVAYFGAAGWLVISCAGVALLLPAWRRAALPLGVVGFAMVCFALGYVCH